MRLAGGAGEDVAQPLLVVFAVEDVVQPDDVEMLQPALRQRPAALEDHVARHVDVVPARKAGRRGNIHHRRVEKSLERVGVKALPVLARKERQ